MQCKKRKEKEKENREKTKEKRNVKKCIQRGAQMRKSEKEEMREIYG
jgi:hypothetical protein